MEASGVDRESYLEREKTWYDASILAMDVEISRLIERLEELGLAEDTLIALVSDHGEEFLEHGRSFHGANIYGEHTNVPLMLWWPNVVPPTAIDETVETIDLVPTLLELARVAVPEQMQGRSLLPLLAEPEQRAELGWVQRPAFSERRPAPAAFPESEDDRFAQISLVSKGWRLVKNFQFRAGHREIELYDHVEDPINLVDIADDHPEVIAELLPVLEEWYEQAKAAKVEPDADSEMSSEDLERLRALGYVN
jgi:arylsulfatase A-like enzyme